MLAVVERIVIVATPDALVTAELAERVPPVVVNPTVLPLKPPLALVRVAVSVIVVTPSAATEAGEALNDREAAVKVTVACLVTPL